MADESIVDYGDGEIVSNIQTAWKVLLAYIIYIIKTFINEIRMCCNSD